MAEFEKNKQNEGFPRQSQQNPAEMEQARRQGQRQQQQSDTQRDASEEA